MATDTERFGAGGLVIAARMALDELQRVGIDPRIATGSLRAEAARFVKQSGMRDKLGKTKGYSESLLLLAALTYTTDDIEPSLEKAGASA